MLFLRVCFQDESERDILEGTFQVPPEHPYSNDILDFVSRMLEVDTETRLDVHEVMASVEAGKSLPPKRRNLLHTPNHVNTQFCQSWLDRLFDPNSNDSTQEIRVSSI
jgi:serine/threonine protein kinase